MPIIDQHVNGEHNKLPDRKINEWGWNRWAVAGVNGYTTLLSGTFKAKDIVYETISGLLANPSATPPELALILDKNNEYDPYAIRVLWTPGHPGLPIPIDSAEYARLKMSGNRLMGFIPAGKGGNLNRALYDLWGEQKYVTTIDLIGVYESILPPSGGSTFCKNVLVKITLTDPTYVIESHEYDLIDNQMEVLMW